LLRCSILRRLHSGEMTLLTFFLNAGVMVTAASADAWYARQLRGTFSWSHISSLLGDYMNPDAQNAINHGDFIGFLNVLCQQYAGEPCWDQRRLQDMPTGAQATSSEDLLAQYPNNRDNINHKDELQSWLASQTWRSFTSTIGRPGSRSTQDVNINYVTIRSANPRPSQAVIVSVGQGEPVAKYDEFLRDLMEQGYSPIYAIEHRAQGTSDRLLDDHFRSHVESSEDFVGDFKQFVDLAIKEIGLETPTFLACHSMGCAIAFTHLLNEYKAQRPTVFNAVVANAPLIRADTDPFPYRVATALGEVMVAFGIGERYAPTKEISFEEAYGNAAFADSSTSSLERWLRHRDRCVSHRDIKLGADEHTGLCLGGVTGQFAKEFFDLFDALEEFNDSLGKISTPTLIQMAGSPTGSDGAVFNPETTTFCEKSLKECSISQYSDSRHNIWWESDVVRQPALTEVHDFLQKHSGEKVAQCPLPASCGEWDYSWSNWGCKNPSQCSRQFQFGDYSLGQMCRPSGPAC